MSGSAYEFFPRPHAAEGCRYHMVPRYRHLVSKEPGERGLKGPPNQRSLLLSGLLAWTTIVALAVPVAQVQRTKATATGRTWLGRTAEIESELETAEVVSIEEIDTGVTRPRRAHLKPSEPVESFAWKVLPPGRRSGFWESYKSEVAAYELDKLLAMDMVPPAVERTVDGETGAAVMWVDGMKSVKQLGGKIPSGPVWGKAVRRMMMFDNLIGNIDRNAGNILVGSPGELILIDHSRAFITDEKLVHKIERVDAGLWERMIAVSDEDLSRAIGPWIADDQFAALIERRKVMKAAVDKLVAKKGSASVIIP
jgi:hypothetical protein